MKHLKINFDPLRRMDAATREIIAHQHAAAELCEGIRQSYRNAGTFGCADMTTEIETVKRRFAPKVNENRLKAEAAYAEFVAALDDAMLPRGINPDDAALLQNNLLRTSSELQALQRRHQDNSAMLRMIEDYAARRGWEGFADTSSNDAVFLRQFAKDRFALVQNVALHYSGETNYYPAQYFEKHQNAEDDYNEWAEENHLFG